MSIDTQIKAEKQVIAHIIADNSLYWKFCTKLKDSFFQDQKQTWEALKHIVAKGDKINVITLSKELGQHSLQNLAILAADVKYDVDFDSWVLYLTQEASKSKIREMLSRVNDMVLKDEIEGVTAILHETLNELSDEGIDHQDMLHHVKGMITHVESIQAGNVITGFPSGINYYDKFTGGFHKTDLIILAAETSQGKTTFALNIALHNASVSNYVGIFSLEMSLLQLTARLTAIDTNNSAKTILNGTVDLNNLTPRLKYVHNNYIILDNTRNSSLENIIAKMRYFISRFGCKFFIVDYLQLITYYRKGQSTEQNLADICRTFKNFAKENDCAIMLLCQLSRDTAGSAVPKLSRLRGSGQIEEAADTVIFIVRPAPSESGEVEGAKLIQAKGRNSGIGEFDMWFEGKMPTFFNR